VIASVDTYLRFAEAVNRLDLTESGGQGLPEIMENIGENGAASKTKGVLEGAKEKLFGEDDDEDSGNGGSSSRSSRSGSASRSRQRASTRGRS
jgi:gas vesicle structural protein